MNKSKFYNWIILGLLISNGILLYFHLNRPEQKRKPKDIVIERLKFDDEQVKAYEITIEKHQLATKTYNDKIKALKNELYTSLTGSHDAMKNDSIYNAIAVYNRDIEINNYNHFLEIKQICKPSQLSDFLLLTEDLTDIFPGKKNKKDNKN
jgi:periplasmic protein CpxP/Spy